jgi:hypothetical protein
MESIIHLYDERNLSCGIYLIKLLNIKQSIIVQSFEIQEKYEVKE